MCLNDWAKCVQQQLRYLAARALAYRNSYGILVCLRVWECVFESVVWVCACVCQICRAWVCLWVLVFVLDVRLCMCMYLCGRFCVHGWFWGAFVFSFVLVLFNIYLLLQGKRLEPSNVHTTWIPPHSDHQRTLSVHHSYATDSWVFPGNISILPQFGTPVSFRSSHWPHAAAAHVFCA